jgi:phasin family protein
MVKDPKPLDGVNENAQQAVRQMERTVEQTMDQTRGAVANYFNFMQKAFSSYPLGGTELSEKLKSYTERNIAAAQEFVHKLSQAKDLQDIIRIQTEFMQAQFEAFGEQTKGLTEAFTKSATSAAKTPFTSS